MDPCPPREQLARLLDERLGDPEAGTVETHVQDCPRCQQTLLDLSDTSLLSAESEATIDLRASGGPSPEFLRQLKGRVPPAASSEDPGAGRPGPSPVPDASTVSVPGYEVLAVLGRGGMGVVYQARQTRLDRPVALKMLLAGGYAGPEQLARFRTEAEAVSRLCHPHIVQIYDIGEQEGLPYLVLEYVEGGTLAGRLDGTPLPARQAAGLVETLAQAVHYAHERGVVHRDLTPRNVLLAPAEGGGAGTTSRAEPGAKGDRGGGSPRPEAGANGVPKITDFGLAKLLAGGVGRTLTGEVVGTPSYMAPEQAAGKVREVGPAADVYALGAILYECLTGRPPFKAETPLDTLVQVVADEPVPPGRLQPKVPRDLETITLKCLRKEIPQRYASALELAEDLRRFLANEPIQARPVGRAGRLWRWCRRNPVPAALTSAVAFLLVAIAVGSSVAYFRLRAANNQEYASRVRAEGNLQVARDVIDYFTRLSEDPRLKPRGLEQLQRDMWRQSRDFYGQLAQQQSDDPRVEVGRGLTFVRLGRLAALLGSVEEARDSQGQAREIFERLIRDHGNNPGYEDGLGQALLELASLHQLAAQWEDAHRALDRALPLYQRLAGGHPGELAYRARLALAYFQLGRLSQVTNQPEQARTYYAQALAAYEPLPTDKAPEGLGPAVLARVHINLGIVNAMPGLSALPGALSNSARAREHFSEALRVLEKLDKQYPDVPEYHLLMAVSHHQLGVLLRGDKEHGKALGAFGKALALVEPLAREHKGVVEYQFRLGNILHAQGLTLLLENRFAEARASYGKAETATGRLAREHPTPTYKKELASLFYDRACLEALAAAAALQDPNLVPADREAQNDSSCRAAVEYLRKAWAAGFKSYYPDALNQIKAEDPELKALRDRDDFKTMLAEFENERSAPLAPGKS